MRTGISIVLAILLFPASEEALAQYEMKIEFPGYNNRTETLTNFPALVVFSNNVDGSGFDYDTFLSDEGWDLRFRDSDDTIDLNYEIEHWDTNGASYIWVQVPEIPPNGTGSIWAKWGFDDTQQACTTNGAVWGDAHKGVWHMDLANAPDSTANNNDATAHSNTNASGIVGICQGLAGSEYLSIPDSSSLSFTSGGLTISGWLKLNTDQSEERAIVRKERQWSLEIFPDGNEVRNLIETDGTSGWTGGNDVSVIIDANTWYHFAMSWNGSKLKHMVNGVQQGGDKSVTGSIIDNSDPMAIGANSDGASLNIDGLIDEVRVENTARSIDWLWASYMSMGSNTDFTGYGTIQSLAEDLPLITTAAATELATNSATLNGTLAITGASETVVSVYWEQGSDQGTNTTAWANTNAFGAYTTTLGDLPYAYATNITGLAEGTTYTYRYYATNDAGESWGGSKSFTIWQAPSELTIQQPASTGFFSVALSGEITGGVPDPQAWFVLNEGSDSGTDSTSGWDFVESVGTQSGVFSNTIRGLKADTLYYARVYVTNEVDEAWSDAVSFSTLPSPTLLTLDGDQPIDGADPEFTFEEVPDAPLEGEGTDPNWLYDFSYYSTSSVPVAMGNNKFYSVSENGTVTFEFNGGSVTGDLSAVAFDTHKTGDGSTEVNASSIRIFDVGDMAIGKVYTYNTAGDPKYAHAGNIQIGTASARAGSVRVAGLASYATAKGKGGNVTIYASGYVHIADANGAPAAIDTRARRPWQESAGYVAINHSGSFVAGNIHAYGIADNYVEGGDVTLTGSGTGSCVVSNILTHSSFDSVEYVGRAGHISIGGYTDVSVADINTENRGTTHGTRTAGNLEITEISDTITVAGDIDLNSVAGGSNEGYALLEAGGSISVGDLDLNRLRYIAFDSGARKSYITGTLANFTGTVESADDTRLRAPLDHRIYYDPELNADLNGDAYPLKGLDGSSEGGTLMVEPARGTVIVVY